ncbi:MAG: molybdopterin-dependent oxidoreductase [Deltaproteobacteria bacterium]|nr:molybdopterin-dependent oxidoreductase [Deltaproteobacteria bacterium]
MNVTRRDFLKVLGTGAAASVTGCSAPLPDKLIPLVIPAEEVIPGEATWYATVCRECPAGCGMLVRTREGRAVKVEGNPDHPVNRGRLCARGQAAVQGLYNPDRIRQPLRRSGTGTLEPVSWEEAEQLLAGHVARLQAEGRPGRVAVVAPLVTGSLAQLIETWSQAVGGRPPLFVEPLAAHALRAANRLSFGLDAIPSYQIETLELLVSFSTDFLETWLSPVELARQFAAMRAPRAGRMGRFVYLGPRLSMTATNADEWLPLRPGTEGLAALGMVHLILSEGLGAGVPAEEAGRLRQLVAAYTPEAVERRTGLPARDLTRLARSLAQARPGLALGGGTVGTTRSATTTQVAVNLLNYVAGHVGRAIQFGPTSALGRAATYQELLGLVQAMARGEIDLLLLAGVNPLFSLPPAAGFQQALAKVPFVISTASFPDETAAHAHLVLPESTPLESWGDHTPWDGVHGLMQPATTPLYQTKPLGDVLLSVARRVGGALAARLPWATFYDSLRDRWRELQRRLAPATPFETFWAEALRRGGVWEAIPPKRVRLSPAVFRTTFVEPALSGSQDDPFVLLVYPSIFRYDGRGANRPWLQELPDPVTGMTWESWVEVNPQDARRLGITQGDLVALRSPHGQVELPAYLYAGVQPGVVAVPLGQGHTRYGRYAQGRGANPLALLPAEPEAPSGALPWLATRVRLTRTGRRHRGPAVAGDPGPAHPDRPEAPPGDRGRERAAGGAGDRPGHFAR